MEIMFRCALLSKAALEAPWHVPCGGAPYGDANLLFIANDWHTALLPVYLQCHYRCAAGLGGWPGWPGRARELHQEGLYWGGVVWRVVWAGLLCALDHWLAPAE
jgi:hypothetical protein